MAAQAVRWPGIPKGARSRLTECSKSCDLQSALHCAIRGAQGVLPRPSTAPGLDVCEWSPEGLYDKSVSLKLNTDEILKLVKKKMNLSDFTLSTPRPGAVEGLGTALCRVGDATSQLDLPSLTPLSVAGWSTATVSSPLGYFGKLLQVVDN